MNDVSNQVEEFIYSKQETIGVIEQRKLRELSMTLDKILTNDEFICIVNVYNSAIERLLKSSEGD